MKLFLLKPKSCPYCKLINLVCFWGPRRTAPWKRPWLFVLSLAFTGLFWRLLWILKDHDDSVGFAVAVLPLALAAPLGLVIALHGCRSCVARLFGDL